MHRRHYGSVPRRLNTPDNRAGRLLALFAWLLFPGGMGCTSGDDSKNVEESSCNAAVTEKRHPGVYDYKSCNECHTGLLGGWVYSNAVGDAWVPGATVTLTNDDGSTLSATTAVDGFFHLAGASTTSFMPCISRCNDTTCASKQHVSLDCQTSACHGGTGRLIYLTQSSAATPEATGSNCIAPASGGPRMHYPEFDDQPCVTCHEANAGYVGGYLYDGATSLTPVSMATVTITPDGGTPLTAITGPGGMFHVTGPLTAPYTACVSKCPDTVCSSSTTHTNTDDCVMCHNSTTQLRIHLP